jgi:hypothetical protein
LTQLTKDAVEDALNYNLNLMGQCLKKGDIYLQRGSRTVITVLSFSDEGNILVYRDPVNPGFFVDRICRSNDSRCSFLSSGFALTQLTITSSTNLSEASIYMFSIRNCNNSSKDKFG